MRRIIFQCLLLLCSSLLRAQGKCPDNIGFDKGNFDGWECFVGTISKTDGAITLSPSSPQVNRQVIIPNPAPQGLDPYGGFPVNCPNGSPYSIRLGNDGTGAQAERVSYSFVIPPDQNDYSIVYSYAVVFQNPPHLAYQKPKFTANVYDEQAGTYIGCSSFAYTAASDLPGFKQSTVKDLVFYKEWTPVTIKLSGMAGRRITLEFTTNDCAQGGHFGYAYIDVSQNCTSALSGNIFCPFTEKLKLVAPFGFADYKWFNADFSQVLGTENSLEVNPVPPSGTKYAVAITPYIGQGCLDTIYTTAMSSAEPLDLKVQSNIVSCISSGSDLTANSVTRGSSNNLSFSYFTDALATDYVKSPKKVTASGRYFIEAANAVGCTMIKPVDVQVQPMPVFKVTNPPYVYRPTTIDLDNAISVSNGAVYNYSYWEDSLFKKELTIPHAMSKTGTYFIKGEDQLAPDCAITERVKIVILDPIITAPNVFTPNGDGIHDTWIIPQLQYYPSCVVEVYNRAGLLMYRSKVGYSDPWDGKLNGKELPVGTYYYTIHLNDELPHVGGSVSIVR